ncbi:MAG: cell wall hydrolase [Butyrivibrio sp.]|nr:cell wall hydrolase [Butyrivibrio sp.]
MYKRILLGILPIIIISLLNIMPFKSFASDIDETIANMQQQEAETQDKISDLEKQTQETKDAISALQGQKEQTQSNVSNLQNQSSALQSTINGYSSKLSSLNTEISEAEEAMEEVSSQIVQLNAELQEAEQLKKERYEALKKRMQATYEYGGHQSLIKVLLGSSSFSDFLTKYHYVNSVVKYDQIKMAEYQALSDDIAAKVAIVEEREAELDNYQTQLDEKHEELAELTDTVKGQLSSTNSSLSSEKDKLVNYNNQLAELDSKMKALESQVAAAQAELAKQIAERLALTREDTSGSYVASASELEWLAATIQAEADGESYTGKLAVGSVIMNRVKSSAFPNTITGVITQTMQFASYRSGKVELIISRGPNSTCIQAAQEVLDGARVGDYLFFMTQYYADYYGISEYTMIGNHAFFYRWVTNKPAAEESADDSAEDTDTTEENTESEESSEEDNSEENTEDTSDSEDNSEENSEDTSDSEDNSEDNSENDEGSE